ncbi:MAG: signal peptide peptidase SppA [Opitutaceae bacterium]|nr:signal peptide peptidase SppA [Opitutaceae bacterium]
MKDFFKMVFACLVAMGFVAGGFFLAFLLFIGILVTSISYEGAEKVQAVAADSLLVIDMGMHIQDAPVLDGDLQILREVLGDKGPSTISLRTLLKGIAKAATDDDIKGLYLHDTSDSSGPRVGYAALTEVREAIETFKASGKPVIAYVTSGNARKYYFASVADRVVLNPSGMLHFAGLASEPMFMSGFFKKYGVEVQVTRVGKYKSAVEPFILDKMSPANREQTQKLLDDLWGDILQTIAASRGIASNKLQELVDINGIFNAETSLRVGLVDEVSYFPEFITSLCDVTGTTNEAGSFNQVALEAYVYGFENDAHARSQIAVLYAEGVIVAGEGDRSQIGGARLARELRKLRADPKVKAVVLRVNSPGGSAFASEVIQHEMILTRQIKPVIVSMGSYAASGGYWISAYGDEVFAEPTTITGSIGVFGILPNIKKLANNHGFTFDVVKTGEYADLESITRPKTAAELRLIQNVVDDIYEQFLQHVSRGREIDMEKVKEMAQGRVWSGKEAFELGLVDAVGGLEDAIQAAVSRADLEGRNYAVVDYPAPRNFLDELKASLQHKSDPIVSKLGDYSPIFRQIEKELTLLKSLNDPRDVYALMPFSVEID